MRIAGKSKNGRLHRRSVHLLPVLLDEELSLEQDARAGHSILTLPLGTKTVLAHLLGELSGYQHRNTLVVSTGDPARYVQNLSPAETNALQVVNPAQLAEEVSHCETTDCLMIVQPRYWLARGYDFGALAQRSMGFRGASHVVVVTPSASAAREHIVCDADGQVRRVHRLYDAMSWPGAASSSIVCSMVPAHVLAGEEIGCPADLRRELAARGVLTQDIPVTSEVYDLSEPAGILSVSERAIIELLRQTPADGYRFASPEILMGKNCQVHPSARVVGPVVLQEGSIVEEGARVIGPALLGAGSRVRKGATLVGSLLGCGASVPPRVVVTQQVMLANGSAISYGRAADVSPPANESSFVLRTSGQDHGEAWSPARPGQWRTFQLALKRVIDMAAATIGLTLLLPLFAVVAALIKLSSPGPVFFVHRRERKGGAEFPCIKFRSMVADAHLKQRELYDQNQVDGPQFKLADDPRETPLGRWLRRLNIDELPQLFNVLVGHMSLVGPRPSPFRENQICVAWRQARLSVRPGITGLWQLCRDRRSEGDFHQWIYYDLAYVRHFSGWLDCKILLATVLTFGGKRQVPLSSLIPTVEEPSKADPQPQPRPASGSVVQESLS